MRYRLVAKEQSAILYTGVANPWPAGLMQPRMAVNAALHRIVNLPKP